MNFDGLVLHPLTTSSAERLLIKPAHAVALLGPHGAGKTVLAKRLAAGLLSVEIDTLGGHAYYRHIRSEDGKPIGIEAVRGLEKFLSLKVPTGGAVNRVVFIEDAGLLGHEAQNAMLKTLEEPPAGTVLLLTADRDSALLPTIRSRVAQLIVRIPTKEQLAKFFGEQGYNSQAIERAYAMSGGLPGLMSAILADDDHPLRAATESARNLLAFSVFERLSLVDALAKDKRQLHATLFILMQMAHVRLQTAEGRQAKRWQQVLKSAYDADKELKGNGQPKLVITKLMLNIG